MARGRLVASRPLKGTKRSPVHIEIRRDVKAWVKLVNELKKARTKTFKPDMMKAMRRVGVFVKNRVVKGVKRGAPGGRVLSKNAESTIDRKQSSKPLIDTGQMLKSIVTRTRRLGRARIRTTIGPVKFKLRQGTRRTPRTNARVGAFHEFGFTHQGGLLAGRRKIRRRFLRPVLVAERPEIIKLFRKEFGKSVSSRLFFFGPNQPRPTAGGTFAGTFTKKF